MSARTVLHPLTLASIEMRPIDPDTNARPCGCELRAGMWWLCGYHEGYEDALDERARVEDDWIGDAESIIHQHYGSDSSDDAHNDWVHDLASEMWRHLGAGNAYMGEPRWLWPCPTHRIIHGEEL